LVAGLGVFQCDDADVWQHPFPFIVNVDRHEIVPSSTHRQRSRKIGGLKIRNEENNGAARDDFIQIVEGQRLIRAASLWFEKQNLSDEPQCVRAAFLRGNKKFNAVSEEDEPDLVIVPDCAESELARDLRRQLPF
jgi:hypothetical protein